MPRRKSETTSIEVHFYLDPQKHFKFSNKCSYNDVSMRDILHEMVELFNEGTLDELLNISK